MNATTATTGRTATPAGNGSEAALPALRRQTIQAIVQDAYGAADVRWLEEIARPEIAGNEVLVKVHAARLDRGTWHLMADELAQGHRHDLPAAPGARRDGLPRNGTRRGKARHHDDRHWMSRREPVFAVRERARA